MKFFEICIEEILSALNVLILSIDQIHRCIKFLQFTLNIVNVYYYLCHVIIYGYELTYEHYKFILLFVYIVFL
jgi:hypothetical protein